MKKGGIFQYFTKRGILYNLILNALCKQQPVHVQSSVFTYPQLKLCKYVLDERLKLFTIKLKSNFQVAAIKKKKNTIDNSTINDLKWNGG